ncbi:MAG: hypothetical protein U5R14_02495 [Gemmatimonadota bacterium]|nr:hypothetical protein [Gemmatimonadota bacterium]
MRSGCRHDLGLIPGPPGLVFLALVLTLVPAGCSDPEPRSLDSLVERDGRYLDPDGFQPYSGPVVSMYPDEPDAVEMTARLRDGVFDGPYERFYRDGSLFGHGRYRDGVWHGPFESFYEDGSPWMRGRYEDGVLDGPYVAYSEDGSVEEEGTYADGEPCGLWERDGREESHPPCPTDTDPDG